MRCWALYNSSGYDENRGTNPIEWTLLFAHLDDDSTHVIAAFRTNGMCRNHGAALGAHLELARLFGMVRSTHARS